MINSLSDTWDIFYIIPKRTGININGLGPDDLVLYVRITG